MNINIVTDCVLRKKNNNDFRSNTSLGGNVVKYNFDELDKKHQEMVINSAKISDLIWCGVDLLIDKETNKGYILELNGCPVTSTIQTEDDMTNDNFHFFKNVITNINELCNVTNK